MYICMCGFALSCDTTEFHSVRAGGASSALVGMLIHSKSLRTGTRLDYWWLHITPTDVLLYL